MIRNTSIFRSKYAVYEKNKENANKSYKHLREILLEILGKKCVRCGYNDIRILQIDHIRGGGLREIKEFGSSYSMLKFYVVNQDQISKNLQLLCPNCNWMKRMVNNENRK